MEVDYSQQPGLEPIGSPHQAHQGQYPQGTLKNEPTGKHAYAPGWNAVGTDTAKPSRHICGLRPVTFGLIAALVFLAVAAAVGGGVGGSIAVQNARDSARKEAVASASSASAAAATASSTTKPSASSTVSANTFAETTLAWGPVMTSPLPSSGCPKANMTIYTSTNGPQKWRIYCGFDMPGSDLIQTNTPSLQLCIETCANWNTVFGAGNKCLGVAFVPSYILGAASTTPPSDCYLKYNATVEMLQEKAEVEFDSVIVQ